MEIKDGVVHAKEFSKLKLPNASIGLRTYDPGYTNTAAATSRITYIDGPNGVLTYRGYPIEELATKSNFLEVAYLLIYGELPTKTQYKFWSEKIMKHTYIHGGPSSKFFSIIDIRENGQISWSAKFYEITNFMT